LAENEIEEILHPIFAKNKKLEFINISFNQIRSLHLNLFDGLDKLKEVWFQGNPIIDKKFEKSNMKMLCVEMKPLFDSYLLKYNKDYSLWELELVSLFIDKVERKLKIY
jgi:Leucine-rich repeat (LRR) protein